MVENKRSTELKHSIFVNFKIRSYGLGLYNHPLVNNSKTCIRNSGWWWLLDPILDDPLNQKLLALYYIAWHLPLLLEKLPKILHLYFTNFLVYTNHFYLYFEWSVKFLLLLSITKPAKANNDAFYFLCDSHIQPPQCLLLRYESPFSSASFRNYFFFVKLWL